MSIVTDFKSIRRKLERQEQEAEYEEKNPPIDTSMYGWPYGAAVPYLEGAAEFSPTDWNEVARHWMAQRVKI